MMTVFRYSLTVLIALMTTLSTFSQTQKITLIHTSQIDQSRYDEIKGSPYLFKNWVTGTIMRNDAQTIEEVELNYNGFTNGFEVKQEDDMIELDRNWYLRVEVPLDGNEHAEDIISGEKLTFLRGVHRKFNNKFTQILYAGKKLILIKDFSVRLNVNTVQDVGKTEEFEKFARRTTYYIKKGKDLLLIKTNKKSITKALPDFPEVAAYLKKEKPDLRDDAELIKLIAHLDTAGK